ncbi:hypothetical protein [Dongia sp. agr-C8]
MRWLPLLCLLASLMPCGAKADPAEDVAGRACSALASRVAAVAGDDPLFLRSYDAGSGDGPNPVPALNAAFTYDNALAAIALRACGQLDAARRIGDALLAASEADRGGAAGRLRNAYRPGAVHETPVPPMGWWNADAQHWDEDPYQVGSATGNLAWAAMALLTLADATGDSDYTDGAARIARWAAEASADDRAPGGYTGGLYGYDDQAQPLGWKSTEHNVDLAAVFGWLARLQPEAGWEGRAQHARDFVAALWDPALGRFWVGTLPDGVSINRANSGLDAELWPLLLADAPPEWLGALAYAEQNHAARPGFDFNDDRDGVWWEGTAQAALVYRVLGREQQADRLLKALARRFSPGGLLWATDAARITTGLALSPSSTTDDFYYFRLPHLGATAWAALAARGWNPFTGAPVGSGPVP